MKKWIIIIVAILVIAYLAGPRIEDPADNTDLPVVSSDLVTLANEISADEEAVQGLKPDNESRIVWYDSMRRTPYVFLYLHGWSASYKEGDPLHFEMAQRYGANLFLPRLYGHGVETGDNFADLTSDRLLESARKAIAVAEQLGDSIIIMGTSTGGTLALYLSNSSPKIAGLILYSPNIRIYDKSAAILNDRWGVQLGKLITGSEYHQWDADSVRRMYWTSRYRLKALGHLEALVEHTMTTETFSSVKMPVFVGCFYKNDSIQDNTVSVPAIEEMFVELGSANKKLVHFQDVGHHVLASSLTSLDLESVRKETIAFIESAMHLKPVHREAMVTAMAYE